MCKTAATLTDIMGQENAENLTDMLNRVKSRAIERHTNQTVEVVFNDRGFVRHINGSDNLNGVKPKLYTAE